MISRVMNPNEEEARHTKKPNPTGDVPPVQNNTISRKEETKFADRREFSRKEIQKYSTEDSTKITSRKFNNCFPHKETGLSTESRREEFDDRKNWKGFHREEDEVLTIHKLRSYETLEPENILLLLEHDSSGFQELLNMPNQDFDVIKDILSVLSKACRCDSFPENLNKLLTKLPDSSFFTIDVIKLLLETKWTEIDESSHKIIIDVCWILRQLYSRVQGICINIMGISTALIKVSGELNECSDMVDVQVFRCLREVIELQEIKYKRMKEEHMNLYRNKLEASEGKPPDDFRELSLLPTVEDIKPNNIPFLRRNRIRFGYKDTNDYLDVQFRLLREDFMQPLRKEISQYQMTERGHEHTLKNMHIYTDVHIIRTVCSPTDLLHRLQFNISGHNFANIDKSKRLIFGSLVCLSSDQFRTLFIATVSNRDPELLKNGYIDVKFENHLEEIDSIDADRQFIMVENSAYFESYRHVLNGLQEITEMPFEKYIVHCKSSVDPPRYIRENPRITFDLRPLVDDNVQLKDENPITFSSKSEVAAEVNLLEIKNWPGHELFNLDESQYSALQTSLTKEFSVIQGPPGTGKTYVGLKIVKTILHNSKQINCLDEKRPMLIVCYTNHALDQFLQGILKFFSGKVIRVGSRLNKSMEQYSLSTWRRNLESPTDNQHIHKNRLNYLHRQIETVGQQIDAARNHILTEKALEPVMSSKHYESFKFYQQCLNKRRKQKKYISSVMCIWLNTDVDGSNPSKVKTEMGDVDGDDEKARNIRKLDSDETSDTNFIRVIKHCISEAKKTIAFNNSNLQIIKSKQEEANLVSNIWMLDLKSRWRLYNCWVSSYCEHLKYSVKAISEEYKNTCELQKEIRLQFDKRIMKDASIIAMTTTGAARYQTVLQDINPRIIIVEEAAEILEAHVITALTKGCEQLILIGDHKQLRPSPNVYTLAIKYNLEVSLFERMIKNGFHYDCLEFQHRMCPEISKLLKPIYPNLKDHASVNVLKPVMGMSSNVYFLSHSHVEEHNEESTSHSNMHEARYIVALVNYLHKQGYSNNQITILTAYTGQIFLLKKLMSESINKVLQIIKCYKGLTLTTVDNYQGEENEIILLSLVRSNDEEKIGFLKTENRVCVALSRAKKGLYVIGNFALIASKCSLWKELTSMLKQSGEIGEALLLKCQNHPDDSSNAMQNPGDFLRVPEGGCQRMCKTRLDCGHSCTLFCHPTDLNHIEYKCPKSCLKLCKEGHLCPKQCFRHCGNCETKVPKRIPKCGHEDMVECHMPPTQHICTRSCYVVLECGHKCTELCGYNHECMATVEKIWSCGHSAFVLCINQTSAICDAPCTTVLECGHQCQGNCHKCHSGRLHQSCCIMCESNLSCGHISMFTCSSYPACMESCNCVCPHCECKGKCGDMCQRCEKPCDWNCEHFKCGKQCSLPCDRQPCNLPCKKQLRCDHDCIGLCGEPCPDKCRICNKKEFTVEQQKNDLVRFVELENCGHVIEYKQLDIWMSKDTGTTNLKCCPICNVQINYCLRYGNIISRIWNNIINIQNIKYANSNENIDRLKREVKEKLRQLNDEYFPQEFISKRSYEIDEAIQRGLQTIEKLYTEITSEIKLVAMQNQLNFLGIIADLHFKLCEMKYDHSPMKPMDNWKLQNIKNGLILFIEWITLQRKVFSQQEISDARKEVSRQSFLLKLFNYKLTISGKGLPFYTICSRINKCFRLVWKNLPLTTEDMEELQRTFASFEELVSPSKLVVSVDEIKWFG